MTGSIHAPTMDLLSTPEQDEIRASAAAFLDEHFSRARIRELISRPDPIDDAAWRAVADLGWFGLGLPEADGGIGCGVADEALLFREIGRSLAPGPYLGTVLGVRVAAASDTDLAARILAGEAGVAIALDRPTGELRVVDGTSASHVLVLDADGAVLHRLDDLVGRRMERCLDDATRLMVGSLDGVEPVATSRGDEIFHRALVLSAAMLVGIAERCRDISAEHVTARHQFGKPIGSNQAVKHPVADMAVRAGAAWPQTLVAALSIDESHPGARFQSLAARVTASEAAEQNAAATIQVHGGMGYTFEHDAHLLLKRAVVLSMTCGGDDDLLAQLADVAID